jgi:hypothetical protein
MEDRMSERRLMRRMAGLLNARLPELRLEEVYDPRRWYRRWALPQVLRAVLVGLMAGCNGLSELETLTERMAVGARRLLRLPRRLADTTVRDIICRLDVDALRACLRRLVWAAQRRGALTHGSLPFHVVALDGKVTALPCWDEEFVQKKTPEEGAPHGLLRTVTCALVSAPGRPCLDAIPIPAKTNEMGHFQTAFAEVLANYGSLFRLVTYDAGASSEANGAAVVAAGKDYAFRLRNESRYMYRMAQELCDEDDVAAETVDVLDNDTTVTRKLVLVAVQRHFAFGRNNHRPIGPDDSIWKHTKTLLRIESITCRGDSPPVHEVRYWNSSLPADALTPKQWLEVTRSHWGVENNNHHTLDTAFEEDARPWIKGDPRGTLAVLLLRRIAYTLLTLFRSVTQRSEERRGMGWKVLLSWVRDMLVGVSEAEVSQLRRRGLAAALG